MSSLQFKIVSDPKEAKDIWNKFSNHQVIDDEWDFRATWIKYLDFPLHFIVGYDKDEPVGLLPLQLNTNKGISQKLLQAKEPFLEFFGGVDTDDNKVWLKKGYEDNLNDLLQQIKGPAILTSLKDIYKAKDTEAQHYLDRFELNLEKLPDFETFLQVQFDGVSRQRLINRLNKLNRNYKIEIEENAKDHLQVLFDLSIKRFGENSSFNMEDRRKVYSDFPNIFDVDIFTINVDGKPKAISYAIMFNQAYTSINVGYDIEIRDIGKLLVTTQIKRAIKKGAKTFDAGQGDNGWKEHFHLTKIPQYKLTLT